MARTVAHRFAFGRFRWTLPVPLQPSHLATFDAVKVDVNRKAKSC